MIKFYHSSEGNGSGNGGEGRGPGLQGVKRVMMRPVNGSNQEEEKEVGSMMEWDVGRSWVWLP